MRTKYRMRKHACVQSSGPSGTAYSGLLEGNNGIQQCQNLCPAKSGVLGSFGEIDGACQVVSTHAS